MGKITYVKLKTIQTQSPPRATTEWGFRERTSGWWHKKSFTAQEDWDKKNLRSSI